MRILRAVIEIAMLPMFHPRQNLSLRGTVVLQGIGDDQAWDRLAPFEELAEELLRGRLISPALDQNIQPLAVHHASMP
jgi:hypothetical protein